MTDQPQTDSERFYGHELDFTEFNKLIGTHIPSPCEVCGKEVHLHDWVDLDDNGCVIACSEEK